MTFISVLAALYAIVRSIFSKPMGRFADKHSFAKMLNICFSVMLLGFAINVFTVPANGKVFFTIYYMINAAAMSGINSSTINLIYDYVDKEKRTSALALSGTLSGIAGFLTTLAVSPLVSYVQNNNNTFLGIHVYAQQLVSFIAVILLALLIVYLNTVVRKLKK